MNTSDIAKDITLPCSHEGNDQAHVVQFYTEDAFLLDGLCQFVRNALSENESAIVVVSKAHRDGLTRRLQDCGVDVAGAIENGRCMLIDAADALAKFMDGGVPNQKRFISTIGSLIQKAQSVSGGKRVAVFGEMVSLLWGEEKFAAALQLEQFSNELSRTHSFYLRCAYPASGFQGGHKSEPYFSVCSKHSGVVLAESWA